MPTYETLLVADDGPVRTIAIDRPKALNALNARVFAELNDVLAATEREAAIRVVVLKGAGEKSFVAGADIKEFAALTPETAEIRTWKGMHLYDRMRRLPQPLIASIHGYALGGGMLIALACDLRVASETAEFGYPEIRLGIFPGTGGTVLFDRLIGHANARALCLTGERFAAARAHQLGIVTHLVPRDALPAKTAELASLLASYSLIAIRNLKRALNASLERDFEAARAEEAAAYRDCFEHADVREGVAAFVEKRPPKFEGR
jgi:enoyl-CoA hydratase